MTQPPDVPLGDPAPRHVLVVDDHPAVARLLGDLLDRAGHRSTIALGGADGVKAFHEARAAGTPFSVVITDLSMTGVNGLAVAAAVKHASPLTPVVLLTAYGLDAEDPLPPHVDALLTKPPSDREVQAVMARLARRGR